MTTSVIFNDKYLICNSLFSLDRIGKIQLREIELVTPFGFFVPIGDGGLALRRLMEKSKQSRPGEVNHSLAPPYGSSIRGIMIGKYVEYVSFFPKSESSEKSILLVSSLPMQTTKWTVLEKEEHCHDSALAYAIKDIKKPLDVVKRFNEFASDKLIEPLIFNLEKLRKAEFVNEWENLKSQVIDHSGRR